MNRIILRIRLEVAAVLLGCTAVAQAETCQAPIDAAVDIGKVKARLEITESLSKENPERPELKLLADLARTNVNTVCEVVAKYDGVVYPALNKHINELCGTNY